MNRIFTYSLVVLAVFVEFGLADELDVITKMAVDERPDYLARKLEEYSDNFVSSVMKLKVSEKGSRRINLNFPGQGPTYPGGGQNSEMRKVELEHELVLSIEDRYVNILEVEGTRTVLTFDGKTGYHFRYAITGKQTQVDFIDRLPSISISLAPFIKLTGVTDFDSCSNTKLIADVREMEWGGRLYHPDFGDYVALLRHEKGKNGSTKKRTMYFGLRESTLVLLRDELETTELAPGSRLQTYRWSSDFDYGQKFGKLLPEKWTRVITQEWTDSEGNLVHKPSVIHSTTNAITNCEFLDRFPDEMKKIAIDPAAIFIDRREQQK